MTLATSAAAPCALLTLTLTPTAGASELVKRSLNVTPAGSVSERRSPIALVSAHRSASRSHE